MKLLKVFKESTLQTKIFFIVAISVFILTLALCIYPYIWFDMHRSVDTTLKKDKL